MTGPMIITANARLALVLRHSYDRNQIENGHAVWTAPDILPIGAWLERSWRSWIYRTQRREPGSITFDIAGTRNLGRYRFTIRCGK